MIVNKTHDETVEVTLTRQDVVHLLKGITPSYSAMSHPLISANGYYIGGHNDRWDWNYNAFQNNTMVELLEAYHVMEVTK